jgi:hypothetical protein
MGYLRAYILQEEPGFMLAGRVLPGPELRGWHASGVGWAKWGARVLDACGYRGRVIGSKYIQ